jgi:hypothetical protein
MTATEDLISPTEIAASDRKKLIHDLYEETVRRIALEDGQSPHVDMSGRVYICVNGEESQLPFASLSRNRVVRVETRLASDMSMPGGINEKTGLRLRLCISGKARQQDEKREPKRGWSRKALEELFAAHVRDAIAAFKKNHEQNKNEVEIDEIVSVLSERLSRPTNRFGIRIGKMYTAKGPKLSVSMREDITISELIALLDLLGALDVILAVLPGDVQIDQINSFDRRACLCVNLRIRIPDADSNDYVIFDELSRKGHRVANARLSDSCHVLESVSPYDAERILSRKYGDAGMYGFRCNPPVPGV